jgi:hypothetical protein
MVGSYGVLIDFGIDIRNYQDYDADILHKSFNEDYIDVWVKRFFKFTKYMVIGCKGFFRQGYYRQLMFANRLLYIKCKHNREF